MSDERQESARVEIRHRLHEASSQIAAILDEFEKSTGSIITGLSLDQIDVREVGDEYAPQQRIVRIEYTRAGGWAI